MKNHNSQKLKGRVAVISSDGKHIDYQDFKTILGKEQARRTFNRLVAESARCHQIDHESAANDLDQLSRYLWIYAMATLENNEAQFDLRRFADEVIALYGSGNYVFDFSETCITNQSNRFETPHKLSRNSFMNVLRRYGYASLNSVCRRSESPLSCSGVEKRMYE